MPYLKRCCVEGVTPTTAHLQLVRYGEHVHQIDSGRLGTRRRRGSARRLPRGSARGFDLRMTGVWRDIRGSSARSRRGGPTYRSQSRFGASGQTGCVASRTLRSLAAAPSNSRTTSRANYLTTHLSRSKLGCSLHDRMTRGRQLPAGVSTSRLVAAPRSVTPRLNWRLA